MIEKASFFERAKIEVSFELSMAIMRNNGNNVQ